MTAPTHTQLSPSSAALPPLRRVISRRQCLLLLLLATCTEAFARPSVVRPTRSAAAAAHGGAGTSRRSVLQAPRTSTGPSQLDDEGSGRRPDRKRKQQQPQRPVRQDHQHETVASDSPAARTSALRAVNAAAAEPTESAATAPPSRRTGVAFVAETKLPTDLGAFQLRAYRVADTEDDAGSLGWPRSSAAPLPLAGGDPCVIYAAERPPFGQTDVPVRIHDQCLTSEVFRSQRCDCKEQLQMALKHIQRHGGCIIYLQQEGRGIGLANKVAAYALQDLGLDTVDANLHLGFPEDMREYGVVPAILEDLKINSVRLLTNNPRKVQLLEDLGVDVRDTVPMVVPQTNPHNVRYMETKRRRMRHDNLAAVLGGGAPPNGGMAPRRSSADSAANVAGVVSGGATVLDSAAAESIAAVEDGAIASDPVNGATSGDGAAGVQAASDGYCFGKQSVVDAIEAISRGEMVVVVDDMNRENEGDFIMAADLCTDLDMARIVRYSSGVVCVAMEDERMRQLELPPMVTDNQDPKGTAFSVTVDAHKKHGVTTGISAGDRALTVRLLADPSTTAGDFCRPGHLFPLRAKAGGVLERDGHTEAAVDLSRLAGRAPVGVLCEIVSEEHPTKMMRLPELKIFCRRHGLVMTSIVDIAQYRRETGQ